MISGSIHHITQIEFKPRSGISHEWVHLEITDKNGSSTELNLFFDLPHQREMFLEQIGLKVLA